MSSRRAQDTLLALQCQLGEPHCWRDFVRHFEAPLAFFLTQKVGRDAAWDVLQDVWIKATKNIKRLENPQFVRSWLYSIAHGLAVDWLRKRDRWQEEPVEELPETIADAPTFDRFDAEAIHRALATLTPAHREVMSFYFLEDMTVAEIAYGLDTSPGTIKSRLYYARQALRQALERAGYDPENTR